MTERNLQKKVVAISQKAQVIFDEAVKRLPKEDLELMASNKIDFNLNFFKRPEEPTLGIISRGAREEFSCAQKHAGLCEGHLEESVANMAAMGNQEMILKVAQILRRQREVRKMVEDLIWEMIEKKIITPGCGRCG